MNEMVPADKDDSEDYLLGMNNGWKQSIDSHSYYSSTSSTISTDLVVELLNDNVLYLVEYFKIEYMGEWKRRIKLSVYFTKRRCIIHMYY